MCKLLKADAAHGWMPRAVDPRCNVQEPSGVSSKVRASTHYVRGAVIVEKHLRQSM